MGTTEFHMRKTQFEYGRWFMGFNWACSNVPPSHVRHRPNQQSEAINCMRFIGNSVHYLLPLNCKNSDWHLLTHISSHTHSTGVALRAGEHQKEPLGRNGAVGRFQWNWLYLASLMPKEIFTFMNNIVIVRISIQFWVQKSSEWMR